MEIYIKGGVDPFYGDASYLQGMPGAVFGRTPYLEGDVFPVYTDAIFIKGFTGEGVLMYGRIPYLQGIVTAIEFTPKPTVGTWFLRLSSVMEEVS